MAEGHLLACGAGEPGERYILGCENLTLAQIFATAGEDQRPCGAGAADPVCAGIRRGRGEHRLGRFDRQRSPGRRSTGVRMARKKMWVSHEKAARELGFSPGPVEGALERAVEWFRGNGYCVQ